MAEKGLLEKLQDEYVNKYGASDDAVIAAFVQFAEQWLVDNTVTGLSYTVDGLVLRMAGGDSYTLVKAADTDLIGGAVSVTGMTKLNARATPTQITDFPITGR